MTSNKQRAKTLAQNILDSEFDNFTANPKDYCKAMGWNEQGQGTKKAIKHKDDIAFTSEDVDNLASILESRMEVQPDATVIDVMESNAVQDFLPNCVATHIVNHK